MNLVSDFNHEGDILMEKLRKKADGKTSICLHKEINALTLDVISHVNLYYCLIKYQSNLNYNYSLFGNLKIAFNNNSDCVNGTDSKLNYFIGQGLDYMQWAYMSPFSKV
jgi:hypothetical protein